MPIHSLYTVIGPLLLFIYLLITYRTHLKTLSPWLALEITALIAATWAVSQLFWDPIDNSLTIHAFPLAWVWLRMPKILQNTTLPNNALPILCASLCWFQIFCVDLLQVGIVLQRINALAGIGGAGFLDGLLAHPLVLFFVISLFYLKPPAATPIKHVQ